MSKNHFLVNTKKAITAMMGSRLTFLADGIPYTFDKVSRRKIFNACLTELSTYFKPDAPWGLPTHIMMEPSTFCNLRCALCPVTIGLKRPAGNMDPFLFQGLLDEIGDYLFTILLWDWGEPFLNPQIYRMIAYAKKYDIKVISSTNGHIFENMEHADLLVRSGIDTIIFAIDGIRDETYSAYRQGGSLASALRGLETVVSRKRELHSKTPLVVFRFIVMEHNEHEIPELKTLAKSIGADALTLKTLNAASQDPYFASGASKREQFIRFMPKSDSYRRFKIGSGRLEDLRLTRNPCRNLWTTPTIHWNGTVCPCTYDPRERYVLGNLKNSSFKRIWDGRSYRSMRRRFRQDWAKIGLCTECSYAYRGGDCSRETTSEVIFFERV